MTNILSKIDECDRSKTGVLVRIRRIRGFVHDLQKLEVDHLTHWQRKMCLSGFFIEIDELLNEAQYILTEFTDDAGERGISIECLCNDITELEEKVFELEEENALLKKQIEELKK